MIGRDPLSLPGTMCAAASDPGWMLRGLPASAPAPELADRLQLFGQFVGDWDIVDWRNLREDGTWDTGRGELHWRWILEGRAVQDIWSTIDEGSGEARPLGTTIRFYDPAIDAWQSVWISPVNGIVRVFQARPRGSEIILEGPSRRGRPLHWVFSEVMPESFRWREEELRSAPSGWVLSEEMHLRRRTAPAGSTGP